MTLLPQILSLRKEADAATLLLLISKDLDYFRGHFPGLPILPGVVQVDWAIRFAEEYLGIPTGRFTGMKALKFSAPIQPDLRLTLELRWRPDTHRLEFTYLSQSQKYSSGQMLFSGAPA